MSSSDIVRQITLGQDNGDILKKGKEHQKKCDLNVYCLFKLLGLDVTSEGKLMGDIMPSHITSHISASS